MAEMQAGTEEIGRKLDNVEVDWKCIRSERYPYDCEHIYIRASDAAEIM
jgi:hypothetical protein